MLCKPNRKRRERLPCPLPIIDMGTMFDIMTKNGKWEIPNRMLFVETEEAQKIGENICKKIIVFLKLALEGEKILKLLYRTGMLTLKLAEVEAYYIFKECCPSENAQVKVNLRSIS